MNHSEKFWIENPADIFSNVNIFPSNNMTDEQKYNSITRLIILIAIFLYILGWKSTSIFFFLSIILIVFVYYQISRKSLKTTDQSLETGNSRDTKYKVRSTIDPNLFQEVVDNEYQEIRLQEYSPAPPIYHTADSRRTNYDVSAKFPIDIQFEREKEIMNVDKRSKIQNTFFHLT
jgi:hypothetical protein